MTIKKDQVLKASHVLETAERVLIIAHQKPDGDTGGSSLALWHWLKDQGKDVHIFCKDAFSSDFAFLPNAHIFKTDPLLFQQKWDVLIVCDSGDLMYAGVEAYVKKMEQKPMIINFDHHASNTNFGTFNFVDIQASSTAEVIYDFFELLKVNLSPTMAKCLLTAVFTDTHGFSNAATNERALEMAANFVQQGASIPEIYKATIGNKELDTMKLWGRIFSRLRYGKHGVAYTYILQKDFHETGLAESAAEGVSNYLSAIGDARAVMVFTEKKDGKIKASMRTYHDDVDLSAFAKLFGGGGHKKASGFTLNGRLFEQATGLQVM